MRNRADTYIYVTGKWRFGLDTKWRRPGARSRHTPGHDPQGASAQPQRPQARPAAPASAWDWLRWQPRARRLVHPTAAASPIGPALRAVRRGDRGAAQGSVIRVMAAGGCGRAPGSARGSAARCLPVPPGASLCMGTGSEGPVPQGTGVTSGRAQGWGRSSWQCENIHAVHINLSGE